jgi:hypothetical protein
VAPGSHWCDPADPAAGSLTTVFRDTFQLERRVHGHVDAETLDEQAPHRITVGRFDLGDRGSRVGEHAADG